MGAALLLLKTFWKPIALVIGCIVLVVAFVAVKRHYDEGKRGEGRAEVQALWDADKARRIKAVTDQTNLWDAERQKKEKAEQELSNERNRRAEDARTAALNLRGDVARGVVAHDAVRVLNDAISAGNPAAATGAAGKPAEKSSVAAEGADSNVGLLTQWGVQCIAMYDEARGMVEGWQDFYRSLRDAQLKGE